MYLVVWGGSSISAGKVYGRRLRGAPVLRPRIIIPQGPGWAATANRQIGADRAFSAGLCPRFLWLSVWGNGMTIRRFSLELCFHLRYGAVQVIVE